MMFLLYWVLCVGMGMVVYFWYDVVWLVELYKCVLYGYCVDVFTFVFFVFYFVYFFDIDWFYLINVMGKMWEVVFEEYYCWDIGINCYVWSVMIIWLYFSLIVVWIVLLLILKGSRTIRFFELNLLSKVFVLMSYGCFLFY